MKIDLYERSKTIPFWMLCICMTYAVFFGTAVFLHIGYISLWHVVIAAMLLTAIPLVIRDYKSIFTNTHVHILVAFGVWLVISAVIGYNNAHTVAYIIRDVKCFAYLAMFPIMQCIIRNKAQLKLLLGFVMYASFALSVLTCFFMLAYILFPSIFDVMLRFFLRFDFINFTQVSDKIARILFVSTPFQLFSCAVPFYFQIKNKKFAWFYPFVTGAGLFSILITYTRALYLAAFVAAMAVVAFSLVAAGRRKRPQVWLHIGASVAVMLAITLSFSVVAKFNYMGYAVQRVAVTGQQQEYYNSHTKDEKSGDDSKDNFDGDVPEITIPEFDDGDSYLDATKASDAIREGLKTGLIKEIKKSPIIGNGLGLTIAGRESLPELFIYDLIAKTGVIGLLLYLSPLFIAIVVSLGSIKNHLHCLELYIWGSCVLGLFVYSCFQPYMNNAPCMMIYSCLMCISQLQKKDFKKKNGRIRLKYE